MFWGSVLSLGARLMHHFCLSPDELRKLWHQLPESYEKSSVCVPTYNDVFMNNLYIFKDYRQILLFMTELFCISSGALAFAVVM
jgi:hypothetical protein